MGPIIFEEIELISIFHWPFTLTYPDFGFYFGSGEVGGRLVTEQVGQTGKGLEGLRHGLQSPGNSSKHKFQATDKMIAHHKENYTLRSF